MPKKHVCNWQKNRKLIAFNPKTAEATFRCNYCGATKVRKAKIVCYQKEENDD